MGRPTHSGHSSIIVLTTTAKTPKLYTSDTRALSHILSSDAYQKSEIVRFILGGLVGKGLLFVEGLRHKQMRRIANPAFGGLQIRSLTPVFFDKSIELRDALIASITQTSRSDNKLEIDVLAWINKLTLDIIGLAGFEYTFNSLNGNKDEPEELHHAVRDMFNFDFVNAAFIIQLFIPFTRIIPTERSRTQARSLATIRRIGARIIAEKKAEVLDSSSSGRDLLSLLIKSNLEEDVGEKMWMDDEELLAKVVSFLVAGHETTSTAMSWTLFSLACDPRVQSLLRAEIHGVPSETPNTEDLDALPYLDAVVRETLRLHSPIATTERVAVRDDVVPLSVPFMDRNGVVRNSLRLTKGDNILVPMRAVNRDKELWGADAEEFRPERWNDPATLERIKNIPGLYSNLLTFLGGTHACIGYLFAVVEYANLLYLIRTFEFGLAISPEDIGRKANIVGRPYRVSDPGSGPQLPLSIEVVSRSEELPPTNS